MAEKWQKARASMRRVSLLESLGITSWGEVSHGKKETIESMNVVDEDRAKRLGKLSAEDRLDRLEATSDLDLIRMAGWAGDLERLERSFGCEECGGPAYSLSAPYAGEAPRFRGQKASLQMGGPLPGSSLPRTAPTSYQLCPSGKRPGEPCAAEPRQA